MLIWSIKSYEYFILQKCFFKSVLYFLKYVLSIFSFIIFSLEINFEKFMITQNFKLIYISNLEMKNLKTPNYHTTYPFFRRKKKNWSAYFNIIIWQSLKFFLPIFNLVVLIIFIILKVLFTKTILLILSLLFIFEYLF